MALKDLWGVAKALLFLTEDHKQTRKEIKKLSAQVNTLAAQILEIKIKFEAFAEREFKNFTEQETLKREMFSEAERNEREKFMQDVRSLFTEAENAHLRRQVEELSKPSSKKGTRKQLGGGKINNLSDTD